MNLNKKMNDMIRKIEVKGSKRGVMFDRKVGSEAFFKDREGKLYKFSAIHFDEHTYISFR